MASFSRSSASDTSHRKAFSMTHRYDLRGDSVTLGRRDENHTARRSCPARHACAQQQLVMGACFRDLQRQNGLAEDLEAALLQRIVDARGPTASRGGGGIKSMSFSSKLWTRLRPASLAAWQALSAAERYRGPRRHSRGRSATTPILAPKRNVRSSHVNLKLRTASRSDSAVRMASSKVQLSSNMPNSSPPRRASVSRQRTWI